MLHTCTNLWGFSKKLIGQEIHVMCFTCFLPTPSQPVPPFRQGCLWVAAWVCVFCHACEICISIQIVIVLEWSYSQIESSILLFHITWMVHFMVAGKYGFSILSVVGFEKASVLERQIVWGMSHVLFGHAILVAKICFDAHSLAQWKLKNYLVGRTEECVQLLFCINTVCQRLPSVLWKFGVWWLKI